MIAQASWTAAVWVGGLANGMEEGTSRTPAGRVGGVRACLPPGNWQARPSRRRACRPRLVLPALPVSVGSAWPRLVGVGDGFKHFGRVCRSDRHHYLSSSGWITYIPAAMHSLPVPACRKYLRASYELVNVSGHHQARGRCRQAAGRFILVRDTSSVLPCVKST